MHNLIRHTVPLFVACALSSPVWAQAPLPPTPPAPPSALTEFESSARMWSLNDGQLAKDLARTLASVDHVGGFLPSLSGMSFDTLALPGQLFGTQDRELAAQDRELAAQDRMKYQAARGAASESREYTRGTSALDAGRWSQAVEAFSAVAAKKGSRADGALYWKAYAEYKLAQKSAAAATIQSLKSGYPNSPWLKDAKALEVEMAGASALTAASASDEELKLLAINSLIHNNDEQAVPMLEKILASQNSPQMKKRALFVLSQSKSPRAREAVLSMARGGSNPDLQLEAIRYVGIFGGDQNLQVLDGIFQSSKDADVKRRILEAYMMAKRKDLILQVAKSQAEPAVRSQAVRLLGVLHANAELESLYQADASPEVRRVLLEAYMIAGSSEQLVQIAKVDKEPAMRRRAIEMLGAMGRGKNTAFMTELYYANGQDLESRKSVINALFVAGESTVLVDIARKETDPQLRRAAVERLSLMKSKEATDFLMELINK